MKWRHAQQRAKTQLEGTDTDHGQGTDTDLGQGTDTEHGQCTDTEHGQGMDAEHADEDLDDQESSPAKKEEKRYNVSAGNRDFENDDVSPGEAGQSNAGRVTSPLYVTDTKADCDVTAVDLTTDRPPDDAEVVRYDPQDSASDLCDSESESIDV